MIMKGDFVTIDTEYLVKRASRCACNRNHLIASGEIATKHYSTKQPNGLTVCLACFNAEMSAIDNCRVSINDNHSTKSSVNHTLEIIGKRADWTFYTSDLFSRVNVNDKYTKYTLYAENRHTSGKYVSKCLPLNRTIRVNGVQITTFEEFDRMTRA